MSEISVVIVSYNTGPVLARCLDSVLKQEGLKELILVDNGNRPGTRERLKTLNKQHDSLKILSGHGNVGFAAGCNIGAKETTGEYLLLLNPDCVIPDRALLDMVDEMIANPEAWLASCEMITPDGNPQGGNRRNLLTPKVALSQALHLYNLGFKDKLPSVNIDDDSTITSFTPAISGAFMLMRLDKYTEIGGLDEGYFFHVEDLDLCLQINQLGGKVLYVPKVKVVHFRSSSQVSSFFVEWHKTDGFIRYFKKHRDTLASGYFFYLVALGIYGRFFLRIIPLSIKKFVESRRIRSSNEKQRRQLSLLNKQIKFHFTDTKNSKTDLKKQEPVIVAGATGQVGLNIVRRLLTNNIDTYALYHAQSIDYRHENLTWLQGDLSTGFLDLGDYKPKTLIYTPAIWLLPPLLDKFADSGVKRIICFSSTSIMGKSSSQNKYEQEVVSKFIQAEDDIANYCKDRDIEWTVIRPTMIYGSGLDRNVSSIVKFIQTFGFFPVAKPGTGLRQPVHAGDLAEATLKIMNMPNTYGKKYNLCGDTRVTYIDMVRQICSVMGKSNRAVQAPFLPLFLDIFSLISGNRDTNGEVAKRMNNDLVFDDSEARKDFGYKPRAFLEGELDDLGMHDIETIVEAV